jgi:wobble nucleotide-excising tRNase
MLTAIKKIKGLGVFDDFSAPSNLPKFKRFNLIYGENGSGKTTLSRLFAALELGDDAEHPDLAFTITTDTDTLSKGQKCSRKIRVFNSDYIEANIGQFAGPIRHILIVGEENKLLAQQVEHEQAIYEQRSATIDLERKALDRLDQDKGKIFSAIAKTIGEATSGSTLRSYRKPDAETAFDKLPSRQPCSDAELQTHRQTVRQDQADLVPTVTLPKVPFAEGEAPCLMDVAATQFSTLVKQLTERTAQSGALARLTANHDISKWVEEGVGIHQRHRSGTCEFCDQPLPVERMKALADHFSAEDQKLKAEIEVAQEIGKWISAAISGVSLPAKTALYAELRDEYEAATLGLEQARTASLGKLSALQEVLSKKLGERSTSYTTSQTFDVADLVAATGKITAIIARHNSKTNAFESGKETARAALEAHYLSTVADQVDEFTKQIGEKRQQINRLTDGHAELEDPRSLAAIAESIAAKKAKVSNAHAGGAKLTDLLNDFLGRTDLTFDSSDAGYYVRRRGKPAKRLSEGEKTAIAFIYFIVQLGDQNFDSAEGIVVIDDPVSSLDSSAIYQAFAYLKNAVKDAKQVFLLTHNFEFLKLLLNWLDNTGGKNNRAYFMLICAETQDTRNARIAPLDQLLVEHPTEYHYLFKLLHSFKSDGTILSCYHIPNVARKVLETFLEFHVPSNESLYKKLEATAFDENKKTAIYKFANDLSHRTGKGFDPALVAETQKNAAYLLEMIKAVTPLHYQGLEKLAIT